MANFGGKISRGSLEIQVDDINLLDSSKLGNLRLGRTCQHPLCHWPQHSLGPAVLTSCWHHTNGCGERHGVLNH